ncbi:21 kDa protein-like [Magnolia sinica]|uniref:21 kDa protein-like n=1 Tax=Magnolia sinica TaxID=86752 RepID=UPI00265AADF2|nr:21 kDa protein-like [Magnolia sinica]
MKEMEACFSNILSSSFAIVALLTLLHLTSLTKTCSAARALHHTNTNTQFIRTSCVATTYPRVCYNSLSAYATDIQTSPKQLAHTALSVTLTGAQSTSAMMSKLSARHGLRPGEVGAMRDCIENMGDSIDELRQSLEEMDHLSGPHFDFQMSNIQTWVSAALTDEDTCMDGFDGDAMNGKVKNIVRGQIVKMAQLTSNALALVNNLASTQSKSP